MKKRIPVLLYHMFPGLLLLALMLGADWVDLFSKIDPFIQALVFTLLLCMLSFWSGTLLGRRTDQASVRAVHRVSLIELLAAMPVAVTALLTLTGLKTGPDITLAILQPTLFLPVLGLLFMHSSSLFCLLPLIIRLCILLGWAGMRSLSAGRKRLAALCAAVCLLLTAALPVGMVIENRLRNLLPIGYGFAYVKGLSSTDLDPYNPGNPENILPRIHSSYTFSSLSACPRMDGAEAAYPVYAALANACYPGINEQLCHTTDNGSYGLYQSPVDFYNTLYAYERLLAGSVDIFFGAMPSTEQRRQAEEAGVELVLTPIALEAFVFVVSNDNPVTGLTTDEVRGIYSGQITNWQQLGGSSQTIIAFQRPEGSGSQTLLQHIMGDTPIMPALREGYVGAMEGMIEKVADYRNGPGSIGYTFRFFLQGMQPETASQLRMLAIDGVSPDPETIRSGAYPFVTSLYAITVRGNPRVPQDFLNWMQGPEAQQLVEAIGYVPLP